MSDFSLTGSIRLDNIPQADLTRLARQIDTTVLKDRNIGLTVSNRSLSDVNKLGRSLKDVDKNSRQAAQGMEDFGREAAYAFRRFGAFTVAVGAFRRFSSAVQQSVGQAFDFERELVKIGQVSNRTLKQLQPLRTEVLRLSKEYGVGAESILDVARTLTQAGIAGDKVRRTLEVLTQTQLAPTFGDIAETGEAAIAIFSQFKNSTSDLKREFDAINAVASNFAVESGDIVQLIRKAGGVFESSGGSLEELIALFTSVRSTTRESADSIATGLRTIFVRLQRPELIERLEKLGVDLRDANNLFVGPYEAFERISNRLSSLDARSETVAQIREELGGFRQVSRVTPLIEKFTVAQDALNVALGSQGSLLNDVGQAQESISVQFGKLSGEFFELISNIQNDKAFRKLALDLIEIGKAAIQVADSVRPLLPLLSLGLFARAAVGGTQFATGFFRTFAGAGSPLRRNRGGVVPGRGPNRDTVPAVLTKGEFVMSRDAVDAIGVDKLEYLNQQKGFNKGGIVGFNSGGSVGAGFGGAASSNLIAAAGAAFVLQALTGTFEDLNSQTQKTSGFFENLQSSVGSTIANFASAALTLQVVSGGLGSILGQLAPKTADKVSNFLFSARAPKNATPTTVVKSATELRKETLLADSDLYANRAARQRAKISQLNRIGLGPRNQEVERLSRLASNYDTASLNKRFEASTLKTPKPGRFLGVSTGGALKFLGKTAGRFAGVGGLAASIFGEPLAKAALGEKTGGQVGSVLSGAGIGAALGSFFGPYGTGIGAAIGGLAGGIGELAKVSSTTRDVISTLTGGMLQFTSTNFDETVEQFKELSAEGQKLVEGRGQTRGLSVSQRNEKLAENTREIFKFGSKLIQEREQAARNLSPQEFRDVIDSGEGDFSAISEVVISEFDKLVEKKPGTSLTKLAGEFGEAKDVLAVLQKALIASGSTLDLYSQKVAQSGQEFDKFNKAQQDGLKSFIRRNRESSDIQTASLAGAIQSTRLKARAGQFSPFDRAGVVDRVKSGQADDTLVQGVFSSIIEDARGRGLNRLASGSELEGRLSNVLEEAFAGANSLTDVARTLTRTLGRSDAARALVNRVDDAATSQFGGDTESLSQVSASELEQLFGTIRSGLKDLDVLQEFQQAVQEHNGRIQEAFNYRVSVENELSDRLQNLRNVQFGNQDILRPLTSNTPFGISNARGRDRTQLDDILRNSTLGSSSSVDNILSRINLNRDIIDSGVGLEEFNELNEEIKDATKALEFLSRASNETAEIQRKLSELEDRRASGRNLLENFISGDNSQRAAIQKSVADAITLNSGGTVPQNRLGDALKTQEELFGELAKNNTIQRLFPGAAPLFQPIAQTQAGAPLVNQLQNNLNNQEAAARALVQDQKTISGLTSDDIERLIKSFDETLNSILKGGGEGGGLGLTTQTTVTHEGSIAHNVNVNVNGAEVLTKLEPMITELVISQTNSVITKSLEASNIPVPPETKNSFVNNIDRYQKV